MKDPELMQLADGELELGEAHELADDARAKVEAVRELGELVRGHCELAADAVADQRFAAMWREVEKSIDTASVGARGQPAKPATVGRRIARWFEDHRGHVITGAVSAGAVAALALVLRGPGGDRPRPDHGAIPVTPASYRPTEVESLETPGGTGTVFDLNDEDGSTTVIWVTPEDTVEGT